MYSQLPTISLYGCLTCKQRRKKCDEAKPCCGRCVKGGYLCLGYTKVPAPKMSSKKPRAAASSTTASQTCPEPHINGALTLSGLGSSTSVPIPSLAGIDSAGINLGDSIIFGRYSGGPNVIPKGISPDFAMTSEMTSLIISQCVQVARLAMFRPFPIEEGVAWHIRNSTVTRWTMFLMAKVVQTILSGGQRKPYIGWIDNFYHQITLSSASLGLDTSDLTMRLAGLQDLSICAVAVSGSSKGYSMFRASAPLFLQLAIKCPTLSSRNLDISIYNALQHEKFPLRQFVFFDNMLALAFAAPPQINYDTAPGPAWSENARFTLEWIYGCPAHIVLLVAKINAWRASRWTERSSANEEWRDIEKMAQDWKPNCEQGLEVDPADDSPKVIGRLAVHECWRHATLIYLYMGVCGANSADPRVQSSVRQIVQLSSTIEPSSPLERHAFLPCLIAGAAARRESHRAILRNKISMSSGQTVWILRGDEFAPVLDHLWHGVGCDGRPTTWDDYACSRSKVLRIDA